MDAVLNEYEHLLTTPTSQTFKHQRSQSNSLSPRLYASSPCSNAAYAHYHSRKRQPSNHRRQCRNEQEQMLSIMKNTLHSGGNDHESFYCEYPRSMKNSYKKESYCMKNGDQVKILLIGDCGSLCIYVAFMLHLCCSCYCLAVSLIAFIELRLYANTSAV